MNYLCWEWLAKKGAKLLETTFQWFAALFILFLDSLQKFIPLTCHHISMFIFALNSNGTQNSLRFCCEQTSYVPWLLFMFSWLFEEIHMEVGRRAKLKLNKYRLRVLGAWKRINRSFQSQSNWKRTKMLWWKWSKLQIKWRQWFWKKSSKIITSESKYV